MQSYTCKLHQVFSVIRQLRIILRIIFRKIVMRLCKAVKLLIKVRSTKYILSDSTAAHAHITGGEDNLIFEESRQNRRLFYNVYRIVRFRVMAFYTTYLGN